MMKNYSPHPAISVGAIALCSRGLVHSRTMQAVTRLLKQYPRWSLEMTHDRPIPDAQNEIVDRVLREYVPAADWILFIEEDMEPPADLFSYFSNDPVQAADYPLAGGQWCTQYETDGKTVLFAGMGCMLVHSSVFQHRIPRPWFLTRAMGFSGDPKQPLIPAGGDVGYGGQDIYFAATLHAAGIPIRPLPRIECGHWVVREMGNPRSNNGCHKIELLA